MVRRCRAGAQLLLRVQHGHVTLGDAGKPEPPESGNQQLVQFPDVVVPRLFVLLRVRQVVVLREVGEGQVATRLPPLLRRAFVPRQGTLVLAGLCGDSNEGEYYRLTILPNLVTISM